MSPPSIGFLPCSSLASFTVLNIWVSSLRILSLSVALLVSPPTNWKVYLSPYSDIICLLTKSSMNLSKGCKPLFWDCCCFLPGSASFKVEPPLEPVAPPLLGKPISAGSIPYKADIILIR